MKLETDIPVDPELPEYFDATPNGDRPEAHQGWWFVPFVVTGSDSYDVRCLDGGGWDRSTWKGSYPDLDQALRAARDLTEKYQVYRTTELREALFLLWYQGSMVLDTDKDGKLEPRPMRPEDVHI